MSMVETLRSVLRFRRFELDPTARRLARAANVHDLRAMARRRLPRGVFEYSDGGAEDEHTMGENTAAFRRIGFRPRVLQGVGEPDPSTTLLGRPLPIPLVLAPTGFTRIADPDGELAVARAAARAGLPYTLSTHGTRSIEEVADAGDGRKWFQLYMFRDRGLCQEMVKRAAAAGFEALVFTVDLTVHGRRERDVRRGFELPPKIGLDTLLDGAIHPAWTWHFVRSDPIRFANVAGQHVGDGTTAITLAEYIAQQMDPGLTWRDVAWLR
jgi:L-lactate dehydrogenase (cytochrome)